MRDRNVLIVGAGKMGGNYAKTLHSLGIQSHVTDISSEVLDSFAIHHPKTLLWRPDEGGIVHLPREIPTIIASNTPAHKGNIIDRITQGNVKSIFSEKPLGLTLQHTEDIEKSARENNADIYTGFLIRFSPAVAKLKQFMKEENLIMTTGIVDWGKNRSGDSRPTAGDLEDEAVHGMDILLFFASVNQNIDTLTISGKLEFQKYVDEVIQKNAHERDPSYPLLPNSSAHVQTIIQSSKTEIITTLRSSFVAPSERRYIIIGLADPKEPKKLLYAARMDFDKRLKDSNVEDSIEIWNTQSPNNPPIKFSQTSDKLMSQIEAWTNSIDRKNIDPRLANITDAIHIARWTDAVNQSHKSQQPVILEL